MAALDLLNDEDFPAAIATHVSIRAVSHSACAGRPSPNPASSLDVDMRDCNPADRGTCSDAMDCNPADRGKSSDAMDYNPANREMSSDAKGAPFVSTGLSIPLSRKRCNQDLANYPPSKLLAVRTAKPLAETGNTHSF
ncbi:MAG: hypothetical protein SGPRY_012565, partial [Prymnesium sp.]